MDGIYSEEFKLKGKQFKPIVISNWEQYRTFMLDVEGKGTQRVEEIYLGDDGRVYFITEEGKTIIIGQ